jgi:glyoxylase I family protein
MSIDVQGMTPLIQVFDMPTSLTFYCDVLGFEVVQSSAPPPNCDWIWLRLRDVDLMLNTAYERDNRPVMPDPVRMGWHRDMCFYFGHPDVDAVYAYLKERGLAVNPPKVAPYGMKQLYVRDPDGYNLCFQWRA